MTSGTKGTKRISEHERSVTAGERVLPEQFKQQYDLIDELIEGLKSEIER